MNKYTKLAWRSSVIYIICMLLFLFSKPFSGLQFAFQCGLFGIFYLGFKKEKLIFSAVGFGWLFFGSMQAIYRVFTMLNGYNTVMAGALVALILMLLITYFAFRAFVGQIVHRFTKKSR